MNDKVRIKSKSSMTSERLKISTDSINEIKKSKFCKIGKIVKQGQRLLISNRIPKRKSCNIDSDEIEKIEKSNQV
jgi:hypothetical protein